MTRKGNMMITPLSFRCVIVIYGIFMKTKQHFTKFLTLFLAVMLLVPTMNQLPVTSIKADESTEQCEDHTEHTEDCGYKEPTEEIPCTHEHDENCGYDPETDTGCNHMHDENCGYVEASEGAPCTFVCDSNDEKPSNPEISATYVNELIAALPNVIDYEIMSKEAIEASYTDVKTAYELFQALDAETKAQVIDSDKLISLMTYINGVPFGLNNQNDLEEDYNVITSPNYPNGYLNTSTKDKTLTTKHFEGAYEIQVYIEDADMEWSHDIIYIGNKNGDVVVNSKNDYNFKGKTFYVKDDAVSIWMTSDDSVTGSGYKIILTPLYPSDTVEIQLLGEVHLSDSLSPDSLYPVEPFSFSLYRKIVSASDQSIHESDNYGELLIENITNDSNGNINLDTLSINTKDVNDAGITSGKFEYIYTLVQTIPEDLSSSSYYYDPISEISITGEIVKDTDDKSILKINRTDYPLEFTFYNIISTFQLSANKIIQLLIKDPIPHSLMSNDEDYREPNTDEIFKFQLSVYQDSLSEDDLKNEKFKPEPDKFSVINEVYNQNGNIDFGEITTYFDDPRLPEFNSSHEINFLLYKIEETDSGDHSSLLQSYYILLEVNRDEYGIHVIPNAYISYNFLSFYEIILYAYTNIQNLFFVNYKPFTKIQTEKYVNNELPEDTFTFNLYRKKIIPSQGDMNPTNDIGEFLYSTTNQGYSVKFPEINYTKDDLVDANGNKVDRIIYIYTVKEEDKDGYANDGRVLQYSVEVKYLNDKVIVNNDSKWILLPSGEDIIPNEWSNKWAFYNSTVSFHLKGEKLMWDGYDSYTIDDRHYRVPSPDEQFTFHVYPYNERIAAEEDYGVYYPIEGSIINKSNFSTESILSAQNVGSSIDFGSIDFTNDSRLENLETKKPVLLLYKIAEEPKDGYHVRYNNYLELYVEKSLNGSINLLYSHIKIDNPDDPDSFDDSHYGKILFENSYPHISFKGDKYVNNVPATENEVFSFNLYRKTMYYDEDIHGDYGSLIATTQNKGKSIQFPEIRYSDNDFENDETVKRYIYTITEESKDGYLTDETVYRYVVKLSKEANGIHALIEDSWLIYPDGNTDNHIAMNPFVFNNSQINGGARIPAIKRVNTESAQDYDHFKFNLEYLFRVYNYEINHPLEQVKRNEQQTIENTVGRYDENGDILPNILFTTKPFNEINNGEKYTYVYLMQEVQTENSEYIQDESLWLVLVQVSNDSKYGTIALTKAYYNIPADALPSIRNAVADETISTEKNLVDFLKQRYYALKLSDNEYPYFDNYRSFIEINASKTVNGYEPSEDETFDFQATPVVIINASPQRTNANTSYFNKSFSSSNVAQNHLGNINFHLDYAWASLGDCVLTLIEETSHSDTIYTVDDTKYLIEVELKHSYNDLSAPTLKTVYKVINWEFVENGLKTLNENLSAFNYSDLINFLINKGYLTIISPDEIVFNNLKKTTSVTAEKVWILDDGKTAADSVTVALYKDGEKYDSITLDKDNNWQYTWKNLPIAIWTVEEVNPPKGFKVSIKQNDNKFIITNDDIGDSVDPIDPKPDNPDNPDKPVDPDKPDKPVDPTNPSDPDNPVVPDTVPDNPNNDSNQPSDPNYTIDENGIPTGAEHPSDDLPLTGQLWWPVWLLALFGFTMISVGFFVKRRQNEQNEK